MEKLLYKIKFYLFTRWFSSWKHISIYPFLSENFMRKHKNKLYWTGICYCQELSEDFIREMKDFVCWTNISRRQILSESFIKENFHLLDTNAISIFQKLSEDFIIENIKSLDLKLILEKQELSHEFYLKFDKTYYKKNDNVKKVFQCGDHCRTICIDTEIDPTEIIIGCFYGTQKEAIRAVEKEYRDTPIFRDRYIKKINQCFEKTKE